MLLDKYYDCESTNKKSLVFDDDIPKKYEQQFKYTVNVDLLSKLRAFVQEHERQLASELLNNRERIGKLYSNRMSSNYKIPSNVFSPKRKPLFLNPVNEKDNFYKRYNTFLENILKPSRKLSPVRYGNYHRSRFLKNHLYNSENDKTYATSFVNDDIDKSTLYDELRWYRYSSPTYHRYLRDQEYIPKVQMLRVPQDIQSIIEKSKKGNRRPCESINNQLKPNRYDPFKRDSCLRSSLPSWKQYYYTQKLKSKPSDERFLDYYDPYYDFFRDTASVSSSNEIILSEERQSPVSFTDSTEKLVQDFRDAIYEDIIQNLREKQSRKYWKSKVSSKKNEDVTEPKIKTCQNDCTTKSTFANAFLHGYLPKDKSVSTQNDYNVKNVPDLENKTGIEKDYTINTNNRLINEDPNSCSEFQPNLNFINTNDYIVEKTDRFQTENFYDTNRYTTKHNAKLELLNEDKYADYIKADNIEKEYETRENKIFDKNRFKQFPIENIPSQEYNYWSKEYIPEKRQYSSREGERNNYRNDLFSQNYLLKNTKENMQPVRSYRHEEELLINNENENNSQNRNQTENTIIRDVNRPSTVLTSETTDSHKYPIEGTFTNRTTVPSSVKNIENTINHRATEYQYPRTSVMTNHNISVNKYQMENDLPNEHQQIKPEIDKKFLNTSSSVHINEFPENMCFEPSFEDDQQSEQCAILSNNKIESKIVDDSSNAYKLCENQHIDASNDETENTRLNKYPAEISEKIREQSSRSSIKNGKANLTNTYSLQSGQQIENQPNISSNRRPLENQCFRGITKDDVNKFIDNNSTEKRSDVADQYFRSPINENENKFVDIYQNQQVRPLIEDINDKPVEKNSSKNQSSRSSSNDIESERQVSGELSIGSIINEEVNDTRKRSTESEDSIENNSIESKMKAEGKSTVILQYQQNRYLNNETENKSASKYLPENEYLIENVSKEIDGKLTNTYNDNNQRQNEFTKFSRADSTNKCEEYQLKQDLPGNPKVEKFDNRFAYFENESSRPRRHSVFENTNLIKNEKFKGSEVRPSEENSIAAENKSLFRRNSVTILNRKSSFVQPNKINAVPEKNKPIESFQNQIQTYPNLSNSLDVDDKDENDTENSKKIYQEKRSDFRSSGNLKDIFIGENVISNEYSPCVQEHEENYGNNNNVMVNSSPQSNYNRGINSNQQLDHFYNEYPTSFYEENSKNSYGKDDFEKDFSIDQNRLQNITREFDPNQYYENDYDNERRVSGIVINENFNYDRTNRTDENDRDAYNLNYENYDNKIYQNPNVSNDQNTWNPNANYQELDYINNQDQYLEPYEQYVKNYSNNIVQKELDNSNLCEIYPNQYSYDQQVSQYSTNSTESERIIQNPDTENNNVNNENTTEQDNNGKSILEISNKNSNNVKQIKDKSKNTGETAIKEIKRRTSKIALSPQFSDEKKTKAQSQNNEIPKRVSKTTKLSENKFKRLASNVRNKTAVKKP